jgi:hypothetical protein
MENPVTGHPSLANVLRFSGGEVANRSPIQFPDRLADAGDFLA